VTPVQIAELAELKRMLVAQVQAVAEHLLPVGKLDRHEWRVGSIAGEEGSSLGVCLTGARSGRWHDFATGQGGGPVDLWMAVKRLKLPAALDEIRDWLKVARPEQTQRPASRDTETVETLAEMRKRVAAILRRAEPIGGTLGERYLLGRGLDPQIADPVALRFLPSTAMHPPSLVALITTFHDPAQVLGLQFTLLSHAGTKLDRKFMKGTRHKGGVIRLVEDSEVTTELGLAEGTETALSVMTAMRRAGRLVLPVWAAMSAGNLAELPLVDGIERLHIFADQDESGVGQKAAETLAKRWREAGREVRIVFPPRGDWNE
jgi:putative DNA primase/helicase